MTNFIEIFQQLRISYTNQFEQFEQFTKLDPPNYQEINNFVKNWYKYAFAEGFITEENIDVINNQDDLMKVYGCFYQLYLKTKL